MLFGSGRVNSLPLLFTSQISWQPLSYFLPSRAAAALVRAPFEVLQAQKAATSHQEPIKEVFFSPFNSGSRLSYGTQRSTL